LVIEKLADSFSTMKVGFSITQLPNYSITKSKEVGMAVTIMVRKNGPYRVEAPEGAVKLVDGDGNEYDLRGKTAFSLCRCGGSVTKPFCDGNHSKLGFQAAEAAVKKEG
jgi:3-phenylpropionate/trans-cinnamate dioxygenase ferredoxin subunit